MCGDSYPSETATKASAQVPSPADTIVDDMSTSRLGSTNHKVWNVDQQVQEQVDESCDEIKVLKIVKGVRKQAHEPNSVPKSAKLPKKPCEGVHITFPEGMSQHTWYPFGIHSEHNVPWNY